MTPIGSAYPPATLASALNSGLATIATSNQRVDQDAEQIANPDNENLITPLLDLGQSSLLTQAGTAVIRTSNEMLGTLLDVFA